jgi:ribosomal protein L7/L12
MSKLIRCRCCEASVSDEAEVCPLCGQPQPAVPRPSWEIEAKQLLASGKTIEAIKLVRETHPGLGLKKAKDLVDSI